MDTTQVKEYVAGQEDKLKKLEYRCYREEDSRTGGRCTFMRDYARVLYSSSFRRLQGKMQLLGVDVNKFNRNRLTHSLEVAQIARSIAGDLGLKDTVVAETAALAHDIGNPPFGHYGEQVLNELSSECGGYEGNAQAFRILRTLEKKHYEHPGLNLNVRTLMAVTKYFNKKDLNSKKFLFNDDYDFLKNELDKKNVMVTKSIDAEIMDLSDEIAYAAHDLEDALSFGMINLDEIIYEFKICDQFNSAYETINDIAKQARETAMKSSKTGTNSEVYATVLKKELTSIIVNKLCTNIGLVKKDKDSPEILGYKEHSKLAKGLKKLLFKAILRKKDIQLYERRGEQIIRGLFEVFSDKKYNKDNILLPPELRKIQGCCNTRLITDYISGMMDSFAMQEYEKYFGKGSVEKFYFR